MDVRTQNSESTAVGNDAIEILLNDHTKVKGLLNQLPDAQGSRRKDVLEQLKGLLTVHNASEENLVYPAIRELAKRPMHASQLYHQQDEAKVAVWELDMHPDDPAFSEKATKLRAAVLAHVGQEEEHEFPHLRDALEPQQMQELTEKLRKFRQEFKFSPPA